MITGCNYGSHPFKFREAVEGLNQHTHGCDLCGAVYFALGTGPCYACASATVDA